MGDRAKAAEDRFAAAPPDAHAKLQQAVQSAREWLHKNAVQLREAAEVNCRRIGPGDNTLGS